MTHTTAFITPVMEHWLEREIAQWVHPMKDRFNSALEFTGSKVCVPDNDFKHCISQYILST